MISIRQIRAARALLGWKQKEAAKACGVSVTTFTYIENEIVSPRSSSLSQIQKAFEKEGIEFLHADGLRMREDVFNIETYDGHDGIQKMLDDSLEEQRKTGQGACWFGVSEDVMVKNYRKMYFDHFLKFRELGIQERVITTDRVNQFYASPSTTLYRRMPHGFLGGMDYGIYGNKLCITTFGKRNRLVAIENEGIANGFRKQFDAFWDIAKDVPGYTPKFEKDLEHYLKRK